MVYSGAWKLERKPGHFHKLARSSDHRSDGRKVSLSARAWKTSSGVQPQASGGSIRVYRMPMWSNPSVRSSAYPIQASYSAWKSACREPEQMDLHSQRHSAGGRASTCDWQLGSPTKLEESELDIALHMHMARMQNARTNNHLAAKAIDVTCDETVNVGRFPCTSVRTLANHHHTLGCLWHALPMTLRGKLPDLAGSRSRTEGSSLSLLRSGLWPVKGLKLSRKRSTLG
jgi:hypothetical protein